MAMSSIIIIAATSLFETEDLHFLWRIKAWRDIGLLVFTFFVTVLLGVDLGIFISIGVSLLMVCSLFFIEELKYVDCEAHDLAPYCHFR